MNTLRYADRVKELKKENRDTSNALMLPRQANNSTKYELKRKNSFESKQKLTGMAAIQNNIEKGIKKTTSERPQTASLYQKGGPAKKSGIPGVGGQPQKSKLNKMRTDAGGASTGSASNNSGNGAMKGFNQNRIKSLLQNNPSGAAASIGKQQTHSVNNNNAEQRLNESIKNAHKLRMETNKNMPIPAEPSPMLEEDLTADVDLQDLKVQHERLVDTILQEEDELIDAHQKFIETTINSSKLFYSFCL